MKIWKHLIRILRHKFWVAKYCFKLGLYWRGITHDMSKFSPVEFLESVKYYNGNSSPIVECKRINGYSKAWMHHKGRNDHHYEYWIDKLDEGGVCSCSWKSMQNYANLSKTTSLDVIIYMLRKNISYKQKGEMWK